MHSLGFINRDIKPENILLDDNYNVKVCDFGWSCHLSDESYRKLKAGTFVYMSPESLTGSLQDESSDVWSLGILLYELLYNKEPYSGVSCGDQFKKIKQTTLDFNDRDICPKAKILITQILQLNSNKRPTVNEILLSSFLKDAEPETVTKRPIKKSLDKENQSYLNLMLSHKPQGVGNYSYYGMKSDKSSSINKKGSEYDICKPRSKKPIMLSKHVSQDKIITSNQVLLNSYYKPVIDISMDKKHVSKTLLHTDNSSYSNHDNYQPKRKESDDFIYHSHIQKNMRSISVAKPNIKPIYLVKPDETYNAKIIAPKVGNHFYGGYDKKPERVYRYANNEYSFPHHN